MFTITKQLEVKKRRVRAAVQANGFEETIKESILCSLQKIAYVTTILRRNLQDIVYFYLQILQILQHTANFANIGQFRRDSVHNANSYICIVLHCTKDPFLKTAHAASVNNNSR